MNKRNEQFGTMCEKYGASGLEPSGPSSIESRLQSVFGADPEWLAGQSADVLDLLRADLLLMLESGYGVNLDFLFDRFVLRRFG